MLDQVHIKDMLNEIPLFAGCSPEALSSIAEIVVERNAKRGEIIYDAGEQALDMFVLVKGLVSFTTKSGVGHLHVESLMKRHMIFGWAALVPEHPRRLGNAKCLEECKLMSINGDALLEVFDTHPQSGFIVMKRLCSIIANTIIEKV